MSFGSPFTITFSEAKAYGNDIFDDSTNIIPMSGLNKVQSLRDRFLRRLAVLTTADVSISEDEQHLSVTLEFTLDVTSSSDDNKLLQFLEDMTTSLNRIAALESIPKFEAACNELWDIMLVYSYDHIHDVIKSLRRIYEDNKAIMDNLIIRMLRIDNIEHKETVLDDELATSLVLLYHDVIAYKGAMKELNALIGKAAIMLQSLDHIEDRLRHLLEKSRFARELCQLIYNLGIPKRSTDTFIRAAKTSKLFTHIKLQLRRYRTTVQLSSATRNLRVNALRSKKKKTDWRHIQTVDSAQSPSSLPHVGNSWYNVATPYLSAGDQALGPVRLDQTKRDVAQLIGTVLREKTLPIESNGWYVFGFVATKTEDEERRLAGLYAAIIREAYNRESIFRELNEAVQANTLVNLFDIKEYPHFRSISTHLESYLNTPPEKRSTVWSLKQFAQADETTEPLACLQRDYGFKFCRQREEVEKLKEVYKKMFTRLDARDIHKACILGVLYDLGVQNGLVRPEHKRLMANDHPSPYVGFKNDKGLNGYSGRFWKKN